MPGEVMTLAYHGCRRLTGELGLARPPLMARIHNEILAS